MPVINFVVRDHKGQPIQNTSFKITSGVPDTGYEEGLVLPAATLVTTDSLGAFTATLVHTAAPYYLSKANNTTDEYVAYKFFVPNVTTELTAELLYVDVGLHQELLNDRSLAALIDAKVSVHNRATFMNEAMASVLEGYNILVGSDGAIAEQIAAHAIDEDPHGDRAYTDSLVYGLWNDRGTYNASSNSYPTSGGTGSAGSIRKGDTWRISVGGTLPTGQVVAVGDTLRAVTDAPGQVQANWHIFPNKKVMQDYLAEKLEISNRITLDYQFYPSTSVTSSADAPFASGGAAFAAVSPYLTNATMALIENDEQAITAYKFLLTSTSSGAASGLIMRDVPGHDSNSAKPLWKTGNKYEYLFSIAFQDLLPSASHDFAYRIGVGERGLNMGLSLLRADPFAVVDAGVVAQGFAAYFEVYKDSGTIVCRSGYRTTTESTVTAVAVSLNLFYNFKITIGTNGTVYFYINGTLVATHSVGIAVFGCACVEMFGIYNRAATSSGTRGMVISRFAKRYTVGQSNIGFSFD